MSQNVDGMVRAGVEAYRAGNKAEARTLLERAIEIDSYNETAWLWLSAVVETQEEQQTCLENVLIINPDNSRARQGLKSLGVDPDAVIAAAQAVEEEDEYAVPSSSASVEGSAPDTSAEEYDDWVGGLNIGSDEPAQADSGDDLFGDIDFSDDGGAFSLDDNIFTEDAFTDDAYDDGAYAADEYDDASYDTGYDDAADATAYDDGAYIDDNLFDDDVYDDGDDMFADIGTLENYTDAVGDDLEYDDSQFMGDPFAEPEPEPAPQQQRQQREYSDEELLQMIPSDVEATRAPGVHEKIPQYHYIILGVLGVVNVLALAFVGFQFVS